VANSLIVAPLDADFREYVRDQGIVCDGLPDGAVPSTVILSEIFRELRWPFSLALCTVSPGKPWWSAGNAEPGPHPPVQELTLTEGERGHLSFRLGPVYGPWEVSWRVARVCGPQVAVEFSGGRAVVVTSDLDYDQFHIALTDCPPGDRDREWF
jgi:hypothetical protein